MARAGERVDRAAEDRPQERGLVRQALGRLAVGVDGDQVPIEVIDSAIEAKTPPWTRPGGLLDGVGHVDVGANLAVEVDGVDDEAVKAVKSGFGGVREAEDP